MNQILKNQSLILSRLDKLDQKLEGFGDQTLDKKKSQTFSKIKTRLEFDNFIEKLQNSEFESFMVRIFSFSAQITLINFQKSQYRLKN